MIVCSIGWVENSNFKQNVLISSLMRKHKQSPQSNLYDYPVEILFMNSWISMNSSWTSWIVHEHFMKVHELDINIVHQTFMNPRFMNSSSKIHQRKFMNPKFMNYSLTIHQCKFINPKFMNYSSTIHQLCNPCEHMFISSWTFMNCSWTLPNHSWISSIVHDIWNKCSWIVFMNI